MKNILMCEPKFFDVSYDINPWMTDNYGKVDKELADQQWHELYDALSCVTNIKLISPHNGLPDMVFTANAGFYKKSHDIVYISKFRNKERTEEEDHFISWFILNGYGVCKPTITFEGEGDLLKGNDHIHWFGHGFRSDRRVKNTFPFNEFNNAKHLEMIDPRFYHLDTCFMPLRREGGVLWYPGAFSEDSQEKIRKNTDRKYSIEVTEEEALAFCCNSVVIKNNIFMPKCHSVAFRLEKLGFNVQQFDMSEFLKSGGACKCLVMFLD